MCDVEGLGVSDSLTSRYTTSVAMHCSMLSLRSYKAASENELRLTYGLPPSLGPGSPGDPAVRITLYFVLGTRQLANAAIDLQGIEQDVDVGDIVDVYIQRNDVPGLLAAVVTRLSQLLGYS